jgi:hypothetical protein
MLHNGLTEELFYENNSIDTFHIVDEKVWSKKKKRRGIQQQKETII